MESTVKTPLPTTPYCKPMIMRPFISPMHEQNRLEPLQMRRVSILRSAGKSSNKPQMSPHEKRLHQIFSSGSIEPLSLTDSDVNQASSSEKGCFSERKQSSDDQVVDDVEMIELDVAVKLKKSIEDVMRGVVVYVEVRAENEDRSDGIKTIVGEMGAQVNDRLYKNTTHVVFRDGLQSTYDKAKKLNIPVVSVLWLEACKKQMQIVNPKNFDIFNAHRYDYPEQYPKIKRFRGIQPLGENARRRSFSPAVTQKHVISSPIGLKASPVVTSPCKPLLASTGKNVSSFVQEVKPNPRRSLFSEKEETTFVANSSVVKDPEAAVPVTLPQTLRSLRFQRRISTSAISSNPPEAPNTPISVNTIAEPQNGRKRRGTPMLNTDLIKRAMYTPQIKRDEQPPVVLNSKPANRRRTLFTPNKVIEYRKHKSHIKNNNDLFLDTSSCGGIIESTPPPGSKPLRKTSTDTLIASFTGMFSASSATPQFKETTASPPTPPFKDASPPTPPFKSSILTANASPFVTPAPSANRRKTIYDDYSSTFSSTRTPQSRRSIIEMSKDILSQRIQNLNRIAEAKESRNKRAVDNDIVVAPPDSFEEFMTLYSTPKNVSLLNQTPNSATATTSEGIKKKRKLFTPPHLLPTPSGVHVLGMSPRTSLTDSDCFNVIDDQTAMEQPSGVNQKPKLELNVQSSFTKLVRKTSEDAILERPTPAKKPRLKSEGIKPKLMTPVRITRRSTMMPLN